MSMWEIDTLLKSSIELIKTSNLDDKTKKHVLWNLENIPELYEFDAGCFEKSELDNDFEYKKMNPYEIGEILVLEANKSITKNLIYDWSAFLLNYGQEYFSEYFKIEYLKTTHLLKMKVIFSNLSFTDYEPIHASLTLYENGNDWFSQEQNELIRWYCT